MANTAGISMLKASSLSGLGVSSGLLRTAYSADIELESVQYSFFAKKELINVVPPQGGEPQKLPEGKVIMDLTPDGKDGKAARYVRKQFIKSLNGAGREGDSQTLLGHEEQPVIKYLTAYCNDWKHGVPTEQFGINAREISTTKLYEKVNSLLAQWKGEHTDYYCTQALCQVLSSNLTASPVSLSQTINPNWYVPGGTNAQQPTYVASTTEFPNRVGTALKAVTYSNIHLNVTRILQLNSWAQGAYIQKIDLPGIGKKGYILLMHPMDFDNLIDPAYSASFQGYWITAAALQDAQKVIQAQVGMIGDILCVRNERAPTLTLSGSASSYTYTWGYLAMGRVDTRATGTTSNTHFNINILLGENALAKVEMEAMHYEDQFDEYKQFRNVGIFGTDSYQIPKYDLDTATDYSLQQESSILVPCQRA